MAWKWNLYYLWFDLLVKVYFRRFNLGHNSLWLGKLASLDLADEQVTGISAQIDIQDISVLVANFGNNVEKLCSANIILQSVYLDEFLIPDESMLASFFEFNPLWNAHVYCGLWYKTILRELPVPEHLIRAANCHTEISRIELKTDGIASWSLK